MKTRIPIGIALSLLIGLSAFSQQLTPRSPFISNLDYSRYRYSDSAGYLEVYYLFYTQLVTYSRVDNHYSGGVKLMITLKDAASGIAVVKEETCLKVSIADSGELSKNQTLIGQRGYILPFGDYILQVNAVDSVNESRKDGLDLKVSMTSYPKEIAFSDIELCSNVFASKNDSSIFYKNSLEVVPNSSLVFGVTTYPVAFYYTELYNLNPDSNYTLKWSLVDDHDKLKRENIHKKVFHVQNSVDVGMANVSSFASGRYRLRLTLYNQNGVELSRSTKSLFLNNPQVKQPEVSSSALLANELSGMTSEELTQEFREAQYLAIGDEAKSFAQLTTTEAKQQFLSRFWNEVANGAGGRKTIVRREYLKRVSSANQRFQKLSREGWQTDRGRVFILYGEPDEVERHPSGSQSKPYEVWNYNSIESGVMFVFIDRSGFGLYELVHSTKRGEIQDESWQQYLQ